MKGGDMNLEMQTDTLRFVVKSKPHKVPCKNAKTLKKPTASLLLQGQMEVQGRRPPSWQVLERRGGDLHLLREVRLRPDARTSRTS